MHDPVADGVTGQVGNGMQAEFAHQISAVRFCGLNAEMERYSNLLAGLSFGQ